MWCFSVAGFVLAKVFGDRIARSVQALIAPALALGSGGPVSVPPLCLKEADEVARALVTASDLLRQRTTERDAARREGDSVQRLMQDVIDASTSIIYAFDREGRCMLVNRAFCALFGRSAGEVVGRDRLAFLPAEVATLHRANDLEVFASGDTVVVEEGNPETDGVHIYLSVKFPIRDPGEAITAVGGISTDITERKRVDAELERNRHQLEERVAERTAALTETLAKLGQSEERFRATFEQAAIGFVHTSFDGRLLRFNRRFCAVVGYSADEVSGLS